MAMSKSNIPEERFVCCETDTWFVLTLIFLKILSSGHL